MNISVAFARETMLSVHIIGFFFDKIRFQDMKPLFHDWNNATAAVT